MAAESLTDERLAEIEARAAAATPPPWQARPCGGANPHGEARAIAHPRPDLAERFPAPAYGDAFREDRVCGADGMSAGDLAFVAAARQDVPDLLAELRRLREENAGLREELSNAYDTLADDQAYGLAQKNRADLAEARLSELARFAIGWGCGCPTLCRNCVKRLVDEALKILNGGNANG